MNKIILDDGSNLWGESGMENLEQVSEVLTDTEIVKMTDLNEARSGQPFYSAGFLIPYRFPVYMYAGF